MIKINIISIGKIKEKYIKMGIDEFSKRLSRYCKLEITELKDEEAPENLSNAQINMVKDREAERIVNSLNKNTYIIALAIDGKNLNSEDFSKKIKKLSVEGRSHITFIIGGSLGLSERILDMSDYHLSFSKMTFPHQLMRLILLEQIYRAFRILNKEPYHK